MGKVKKDKDTWCANAYMNLSIIPRGAIKPCCMSKKEFVTNNGNKTLDQASIKDFWNSKDRLRFSRELEKGRKVPQCNACWQEEAAGKESKRLRDNKLYKDRNLSFRTLPLVIDLSMGNLCNLKCRICSSTHSTQWLREDAQIYQPDNIKGWMTQPTYQVMKNSFHESNDNVWEDIKDLLPNAEKLDFAGGEPFYIDAHWKIVDFLVENGYCKKQHIHYNTNGSIFPEAHIDKLNQFKTVDIQISSDGVGKQFEYMRHGSPFDVCEETINKFIDAKNNSNTNWMLGACLSLSAYNVYDFFTTYEHYASKGLNMYVNTVHDRSGIRILPDKIKELLIERLEKTESKYNPKDWQKQKEMICNLLRNTIHVKEDWDNFWKEIFLRDKVRNESFEDTFPEYYNLLKDYIRVER
jgi:organic radical activating enzyme